MPAVQRFARWFELVLELIAAVLVVGLTAMVVYAVFWRYLGGASPRWYDEVASIMLAWLTYYAAALAALKRGHVGVDAVLMALPVKPRLIVAAIAEVLVIGFFVLLAWAGLVLLEFLEGMTLISLTWVPLTLVQSVIPIGAVLFIIAEVLSMPAYFARLRAGVSQEQEEIAHAMAEAEAAGVEVERILSAHKGAGRP
jgi:TRAP-type C4-dicarboxylate transport system permease small subunit